MKKLVRVQQLLAKVNRQYVLSAAQQHAYRTEPPFKLQGSYRNMNKLAEKVLPAMNDAERARLIDDHYLGEAQTLTNKDLRDDTKSMNRTASRARYRGQPYAQCRPRAVDIASALLLGGGFSPQIARTYERFKYGILAPSEILNPSRGGRNGRSVPDRDQRGSADRR